MSIAETHEMSTKKILDAPTPTQDGQLEAHRSAAELLRPFSQIQT
jgi:hypothetical protein